MILNILFLIAGVLIGSAWQYAHDMNYEDSSDR